MGRLSIDTLKNWITFRKKSCSYYDPAKSATRLDYRQFQSEVENKILKALNLILILFNLLWTICVGVAGAFEPISFSILIFSIITMLLSFYFIKLWKICVILCSIAVSFYTYIVTRAATVALETQPGEFIIGNTLGLAECLIILSLKNTFCKVIVILCTCVMKVLCFSDFFTLGISLLFGAVVLFCLVFCIYYDYLECHNFRQFYKSREEARRFQNLVNKDLPASVLILDSNLDFLYSNDLFRQKFETTADYTIDKLLNSFKIKAMEDVEKDFSCVKFESNLYECLIKFSRNSDLFAKNEGNIQLAKFHDLHENKIYLYEVRLREVFWGLEHAYAVIFNDISDKQIVMTLKYVDQQKNRVINTLSHELKTPINGILGLIKVIKTRVQDKMSQTYLDYCEGCSKLLLNFINSLLDYNQLKQGALKVKKELFNLNDLLKEISQLYNFHAQQKGLTFSIEKGPDLPNSIFTDKDRLSMVLITLLGNSFKFTNKGSVSLKVYFDDTQDRTLVFKVSDTGPGIKEEQKEKLFKMMQQNSGTEKNSDSHGVGLGLATMYEFVKLLNEGDENGGLKIDDEAPEGLTLYFEVRNVENPKVRILEIEEKKNDEEEEFDASLRDLEVREMFSSRDLVAKKIESARSGQDTYHFLLTTPSALGTREEIPVIQSQEALKEPILEKPFPRNILVVDDNPFNILAVSFILEKFHCQITKAFNGQECLQILEENVQQNQPKFDLILMDIQMPVLDGVEASRLIKEKIKEGALYQVPVVALTANRVDSAERERYGHNGILECLEKPLKEIELCKSLTTLGFKQFEK